jgi:hypothetical protein
MTFQEFLLENSPHTGEFIVGYDSATGKEIKIPVGNMVQAGTPGIGVDIQYSANGSDSWHYPATSGDEYMRLRKGTDAWSQAFKIVAVTENNGKEVELQVDEDMLQWRYVGDAEWGDLYDLSTLKGDDGDDGDDGLSAYQVWIGEGNTGSEEDFLNSLKGTDGKNIELQTSSTHIQWREDGGVWNNLVTLSSLKGIDGVDGKNIELQTNTTHIQWREDGGSWNNLVTLSSLKGTDGVDGKNIELQTNTTHIQWREVGSNTWNNLVALSALKGIDGVDGKNIELQKTETHIQWREDGGSWTNLVALSVLKGIDGVDGKNIELQTNTTHIQWRLVGASSWTNLVALSSLKGDDGLSAYRVWLAAGNSGTEQDFLNSLNGTDGEGLPEGYEADDLLIINSEGNPEWIKETIQYVIDAGIIEEGGVIPLAQYARKIIILYKFPADAMFHIHISIFNLLKDFDILVYNCSGERRAFVLPESDTEKTFLWKQQTELIQIENRQILEISLRPFRNDEDELIITGITGIIGIIG